jgi:hypothetical protein
MNLSSRAYIQAGRFVAKRFLAIPEVISIRARRSVAAGEAEFPWSDLDLEVLVADTSPATMLTLLRRFRMAKSCFPRLGESFVLTPDEAIAKAKLDPYRASLDRRAAILLHGAPIEIPVLPIPKREAARRLIFWFEHFIDTAVQTRNRRNLAKFLLEIRNASGVLNGQWPEPLLTRQETLQRTGPLPLDILAECHRLADQAANILGYASREALLMHVQNPFLWREGLGISKPAMEAFQQAARRYLSPERLRGPVFLGEGVTAPAARLSKVQNAFRLPAPYVKSAATSARDYYANEYPRLTALRNELAHAVMPFA